MHTTVCDNSVIAQPQHIIRERESQSRQKEILHPKDNYTTASSLIIDRVTRLGKKCPLG